MTRALKYACLLTSLVTAMNFSNSSSAAPRAPLRVVATTGQQAPESSTSVFSRLYPPIINEKGQTAFGGNSTDVGGIQRLGVWSEGNGTLDVVALQPSVPVQNANSRLQMNFAFNRLGETVVHDDGILLDKNGSTQLVAGPGVPLIVDGQSIQLTGVSRPVINRDGQIAFVGTSHQWGWYGGVYVGSNGQFQRKLDGSFPLPGTIVSPGLQLRVPPVINSSGKMAVWGGSDFGPTGIISTNIRGPVELVVQSVFPSLGEPFFRQVSPPIVTSAGTIVFAGVLEGSGVTDQSSDSLWSFSQNGLRMLGREGDQAPGSPSGVVFESFSHPKFATRPVSDEQGNLALVGTVRGTAIDTLNNQTIWREIDDQLELFVQSGSQAPGVAPELLFHDFESPLLNGRGQIAFKARLRGVGAYSTNDEGIWAEDRSGVLRLVVRDGDVVDFDPGSGTDFRTISEILLPTTPLLLSLDLGLYRARGENDQPYAFNHLGQIAFAADFTDGTRAVLVSNAIAIPEASTFAIGVLCSTFAVLKYRPRKNFRC
jgi:hypothetical protein